MKDDILIINNKRYVHTPEAKEDRLSGWIVRSNLSNYGGTHITATKTQNDTARMIEIRDSEIIVSEDDVRRAWAMCTDAQNHYEHFIKLLGFKKDGV